MRSTPRTYERTNERTNGNACDVPSEAINVDLATNAKELGAAGLSAITPLDGRVFVTDRLAVVQESGEATATATATARNGAWFGQLTRPNERASERASDARTLD